MLQIRIGKPLRVAVKHWGVLMLRVKRKQKRKGCSSWLQERYLRQIHILKMS